MKIPKKPRGLKEKHKDLLFYILMMAFPVAQFCVFYIGVNFNSILLAFQEIDLSTGTRTLTLTQLQEAFRQITQTSALLLALKNSLISFVIIVVISTPLGLLFSYYIYKKQPGHGFFRVILFLPAILSAIVMVTIFQCFVESATPEITNNLFGFQLKLLQNVDSRFATILFYSIWFGFGTNVLMYTNAMTGIDPSLVEASHLDGATGFKEFLHVTLPSIYPTVVTFVVVSVAGIFVNQLNLFSFYGPDATDSVRTYGYYLFAKVQKAGNNVAEYPVLSAIGLMMTVVAVPLTLAIRRLMEKFGPRAE